MSDSLGMILLPLFLMGIIGFVGAVIPTEVMGYQLDSGANVFVYYDKSGHALCYFNGTAIGENGTVRAIGGNHPASGLAYWDNRTSWSLAVPPMMYSDDEGKNLVKYSTFMTYKDTVDNGGYVSGGRVWYGTGEGVRSSDPAQNAFLNLMAGGLTATIVGTIALIVLLGLNIVSSGLNDTATRQLVGISLFSALWIIVSAFGVSILTTIPLVGWVVYLALVFSYFLGVFGMINGGGTF